MTSKAEQLLPQERLGDMDERGEHTPGPWDVVPGSENDNWGITERGQAGATIAQMLWEHDAKFLSSAPDRQLALQGLADALEATMTALGDNWLRAKARAALDKAKPYLEAK